MTHKIKKYTLYVRRNINCNNSVVNSFGCVNCYDCVNCYGCIGCNKCSNCIQCFNCIRCDECIRSTFCDICEKCRDCKYIENESTSIKKTILDMTKSYFMNKINGSWIASSLFNS